MSNVIISIICPYTDEKIRRDMLEASLKRQNNQDYELIALNNRELGLDRASDVLNYGVEKATGDILLFTHQDIELLDPDLFKKMRDYCNYFDFGIGGVAGVTEKEETVWSSVVQGRNRKQAGKRLTIPMEAASCDECFFFTKRDGFQGFADLGDTWHFYAVEYALRCSMTGEKVMLFPLDIYHASSGHSLDASYWKTLGRVAKLYRGKIPVIPTTMGNFPIDWTLPLRNCKRKLWVKLGLGKVSDD